MQNGMLRSGIHINTATQCSYDMHNPRGTVLPHGFTRKHDGVQRNMASLLSTLVQCLHILFRYDRPIFASLFFTVTTHIIFSCGYIIYFLFPSVFIYIRNISV